MEQWLLSREILFQERRVRYDITGQGPPLVMVHGTPWSSFNLRHLIKLLSADFTVYYYDLLGYGQSDRGPGDVSLGVQNQVLCRLLDHWQLESPLAVGHDFGGATLLRTHLLNQRGFAKMVLIDPVALAPWGSPFFLHVRQHEAAFAGLPDYIHEAVVRAYVQTAAFQPLDQAVLERTVQPWLGEEGRTAFYRQIAQADQAYTDEVEPLYSRIKMPVLILWGAEDAWIPQAKGQQLHEAIPDSLLEIIPGSGHLVIEEKPRELMAHISAFLRA
ncbi:MAG: alpha/beta hydrolase [Desulfarculaceae bacterium]|nr:alpha/beta hydrolase [Desulfarculaceae bacterium]